MLKKATSFSGFQPKLESLEVYFQSFSNYFFICIYIMAQKHMECEFGLNLGCGVDVRAG